MIRRLTIETTEAAYANGKIDVPREDDRYVYAPWETFQVEVLPWHVPGVVMLSVWQELRPR